MKRIDLVERPNWREQAEGCGFSFHSMYDARYWDERRTYQFTLRQIEDDLADPSGELLQMCYDLVSEVAALPALMTRLAIPEEFHEAVAESWAKQDKDLYGRFDLRYDGSGPAKLLEFNADTPTSLLESSLVQWLWLEELRANGTIPAASDQFNSIHETLVDAFRGLGVQDTKMYFAAILRDDDDVLNEEDYGNLNYMLSCAAEAGLATEMIDMRRIGIDHDGRFTDENDNVIESMFKLYPLEDMVREPFGQKLKLRKCRMFEPMWKLILSNKGILPLLWERHEGHPNLLPAFFLDDWTRDSRNMSSSNDWVRKPLFSREGANVEIRSASLPGGKMSVEGNYGAEGFIVQEYCPLPKFGDDYSVIGSWLIAGKPCGICIREDDTLVTRNTSRFVPHFFID